ncbi:MAG: PIN domain-containing protein [Acidimicrobiales bacterium]
MLVLDAAALVALDRNDRAMWARLKDCQRSGLPPLTHGGVVGQVWRGGARQARLAKALAGVDTKPMDEKLGRAAGALLGRTGLADVIDAAVALLAEDGDTIVTEDTEDLAELLGATNRRVELVRP